MFADELSKVLLAYRQKHNCTLVSMARMCNMSHHKMGYLMQLRKLSSYKECNSVKIDAGLEDGLRMMGIKIKIEADERV